MFSDILPRTLFICGIALVCFPAEQLSALPLPTWLFSLTTVLGIGMLLSVLGYLLMSVLRKKAI